MNKFLKTMKRFGYISIETVIVAAIMIVAIFTFLGAFVEKGQTASNDAASKIDDVLNLAGGGEGAGPGGSGGGAGGGELPEIPGSSEEPVTMTAGLYDANDVLLASWDVLVAPVDEGGYGLSVEKDYTMHDYSTDTNSMYYLLNNKDELRTGAKLIIGEGLTEIGDNAFNNCQSLVNITIPNSVTTIGEASFNNCRSLESITIPNNVETIGGQAVFANCTSLKNVIFEENSKLTTINFNTFYNCQSLTSIIIPSSVTTIGKTAFNTCPKLTTVTFEENSQLLTIGESAFNNCQALKSITLPGSVNSIDQKAFNMCTNLKSITIPDSVETIGKSAFGLCHSLADVYFAGTEAKWNSININSYNEDLTDATIHFESTGPLN